MSKITWSIKELKDGVWHPYPLADTIGHTLREILTGLDGREIVAEFIIAGQPCYFCGTEKWRTKMQKSKGKAVTFGEAIPMIEASAPALLEIRYEAPELEAAEQTFPGSGLVQMEMADA